MTAPPAPSPAGEPPVADAPVPAAEAPPRLPPQPLRRRPPLSTSVLWRKPSSRPGLGDWRYVIAFGSGVVFAIVAWIVAGALGDSALSLLADQAVGMIGLAFAFSLFTGVGLGLPASIRSIDGTDGSPVDHGAALRLLLFSVAVLLAGTILVALSA